MQETQVQCSDREDPLEEEVATHFSILAWEIPRTEEPELYSQWGCKELDATERLNNHLYEEVQSIQFSSVAQSCLTLCDPMDCSIPGLPVHHQLPKLTQTHVH